MNEQESKPGSLVQALAWVQGRLPDVKKSETAHVRSDKGSYSYSYADLASVNRAVLPLLSEVGLAFLAKPTLVDGRLVLAYSLMHVSGEAQSGEYPLPPQGTPQQIGSAITYARRYVLSALVGVAGSEDDDGAAASAHHADDERRELARRNFIANATTAIDNAQTVDDLTVAGERISVAEGRTISFDDALALRQRLVIRHDDITGARTREDPTE